MAEVVLFLWPLVAIILFARLEATKAIISAILVPYMFLPEALSIPLPGLPNLNKTSAIAIGLVLGFLFNFQKFEKFRLETFETARASRRVLQLLFVVLLIGSVLTVFNNLKPLQFGPITIPAARPWDIISTVANTLFLFIPFWLAASYLGTQAAQNLVLRALVYCSLFYSILMLVEIRLSPQLHYWVYGYYQHSFAQHIRDGYRPMVFLEHGIWVGFFIFSGFIAALGLWFQERKKQWLYAAVWIFLVLSLSENLGAMTVAICVGGFFILLRGRARIWFCSLCAVLILVFPALRQGGVVPTSLLVDSAAMISEGRAASLQYRLKNEDLLLDKAFEKPLTGWAGWGRSRIYLETGRDVSTTDGLWIIVLGQYGWIGYASFFGLLVLPVVLLLWTRRRKEVGVDTVALAMIAAGNLIYIVPNATLTPAGLLAFGALAGFSIWNEKTSASSLEKARTPTMRRQASTGFSRAPQVHTRRKV